MSERTKSYYTCVYCGKQDWVWNSTDPRLRQPYPPLYHAACWNLDGYLKLLLDAVKTKNEAKIAEEAEFIRRTFPEYKNKTTANTFAGREFKHHLDEAKPYLKK